MKSSKTILRSSSAVMVATAFVVRKQFQAYSDDSTISNKLIIAQPSFDATINLKKQFRNSGKKENAIVNFDSLALISGSSHSSIANEISELIGVRLLDSTLSRFSDGEVSVQINENIRGKNVFIIQTCAAPVNDSIIELLLTISCIKRCGARRVVAVIPYFGYKYHRKGASVSSKHHSTYLTSGAMDFAKMLQEMGVDRVISVDLQRPGQGHEACFFDNQIPLETLITTDHFVSHFAKSVSLQKKVVVVAPNAESVKKARNYQLRFQKAFENEDIQLAIFTSKADTGSGPYDASSLQLLGNTSVILFAMI